jgi:hypothetical protein
LKKARPFSSLVILMRVKAYSQKSLIFLCVSVTDTSRKTPYTLRNDVPYRNIFERKHLPLNASTCTTLFVVWHSHLTSPRFVHLCLVMWCLINWRFRCPQQRQIAGAIYVCVSFTRYTWYRVAKKLNNIFCTLYFLVIDVQ